MLNLLSNGKRVSVNVKPWHECWAFGLRCSMGKQKKNSISKHFYFCGKQLYCVILQSILESEILRWKVNFEAYSPKWKVLSKVCVKPENACFMSQMSQWVMSHESMDSQSQYSNNLLIKPKPSFQWLGLSTLWNFSFHFMVQLTALTLWLIDSWLIDSLTHKYLTLVKPWMQSHCIFKFDKKLRINWLSFYRFLSLWKKCVWMKNFTWK